MWTSEQALVQAYLAERMCCGVDHESGSLGMETEGKRRATEGWLRTQAINGEFEALGRVLGPSL